MKHPWNMLSVQHPKTPATQYTVKYWLPSWSLSWLRAAAHCHCPASWESILPHITSPVKDLNSKFKEQFLLNATTFARLQNIGSQTIVSQEPSVFRLGLPGLLYLSTYQIIFSISYDVTYYIMFSVT